MFIANLTDMALRCWRNSTVKVNDF